MTGRAIDIHPAICYHRHRMQKWDGPLPGMGLLTLVCNDCGASASASYYTPMPDLPPMPLTEQEAEDE
jgi:hypothetical protein